MIQNERWHGAVRRASMMFAAHSVMRKSRTQEEQCLDQQSLDVVVCWGNGRNAGVALEAFVVLQQAAGPVLAFLNNGVIRVTPRLTLSQGCSDTQSQQGSGPGVQGPTDSYSCNVDGALGLLILWNLCRILEGVFGLLRRFSGDANVFEISAGSTIEEVSKNGGFCPFGRFGFSESEVLLNCQDDIHIVIQDYF